MKKFFTLCAALTMVMGASAAPQFAKSAKAEKPMSEHKLVRQMPAKVAAPMKKAQKATALNMGVKKAQAAAIDLTYDELSISDFGSDVWFIATTSDGSMKVYMNPAVPMSDLEFGKVYTADDMLMDYTYIWDYTLGEYVYLSSVEFVLEENDLYGMVFDANVVSEDGQEYHAYYKALEVPTEFTEVAMGEMTSVRLSNFIEDLGSFQFVFNNDEYAGGLCFEAAQVAGTYTEADCYGALNQYTYLTADGGYTQVKLCAVEAEITEAGENIYNINAKLYGYDGNVYLLDAKYAEPKPEKTASIVASNLIVDTSSFDLYWAYYGYGLATIYASSDEYEISGSLLSYDGVVVGHYDSDDHVVSGITIIGEAETEAYAADIDVTKENGVYAIKGEILAWDNTVYTLDLSFTVPAITETRDFVSDAAELNDLTASLGAWQVVVDDVDWFSVVVDADAFVSGHYTEMSPAYTDYCQIVLDQYGAGEVLNMYSIDFYVTVNDDSFTLTGTCQAGSILYNVNISGGADGPEPGPDPNDMTEDVEYTFSVDQIDEFEVDADNGYAYLRASDGAYLFGTLIFIDGDELAAGTYEINDSYAVNSVQAGALSGNSVYPTFFASMTEDGYLNLPLFFCVAGTVTVSYDAEGNPSIVCEATNNNGYNAHIEVNPQGAVSIENVAAQAAKNGKFFENNAVVIRNNGQQYNAFGQIVK